MSERYKDVDEEAAYELSHLLKEDEGRNYDDDDHHADDDAPAGHGSHSRLAAQPRDQVKEASHAPRPSTEYLDGLRGLAAVWVFVQHFMPTFTMGAHEPGFGQEGNYHFVSLPYVRLFFGNGGNAAVVVFFVLSGYVLSVSPLRKLKQEKAWEVRKGLLGAMIRRPIRLYIPPFTISLIHALLLHVPGLFLPVIWLHPEERTVAEEITWWWEKTSDYFWPWREHGSNIFMYPYNIAMWTLPIEMAGSFVVYGTLAVLSLGLRGPDPHGPAMVVVLIFCAAAAMLQHFWKWSMACFLFGMLLAILDTWPVGDELRSLIRLPSWLRLPTSGKSKHSPGSTPGVLKRCGTAGVKIIPEWLRRRLSKSSPGPRDEPQKSTIWPHICFFVGFYLLSEPAHAGDRNFSLKTPGWVTLTKMIPEQYDESRYYRYWQTWGALLAVYSVCRIRWLQRFFMTRFLRFLGFVSFMFYLVHLPFFRVFPDRFVNLIGYNGDPNAVGTFWDKTWEIPDVGPVGLTTRLFVGMAVCFPVTLFVAYLATISIDQPSVRLSKLVTRLIGLDKKPEPAAGPLDLATQVSGSTEIYNSDKDMEDVELQDVAYRDEEHQSRRRSHDVV